MDTKDNEKSDTMSIRFADDDNTLCCRITVYCNMKKYPNLDPSDVIDEIQDKAEHAICFLIKESRSKKTTDVPPKDRQH